jgi:hypothetical protein
MREEDLRMASHMAFVIRIKLINSTYHIKIKL